MYCPGRFILVESVCTERFFDSPQFVYNKMFVLTNITLVLVYLRGWVSFWRLLESRQIRIFTNVQRHSTPLLIDKYGHKRYQSNHEDVSYKTSCFIKTVFYLVELFNWRYKMYCFSWFHDGRSRSPPGKHIQLWWKDKKYRLHFEIL